MTKKLFQVLILTLLFLGLQKQVYGGTACSVPATGGSLLESCTFTYGEDGVDAGTGTTNTAVLTVPNGVQLTISATHIIAAGSISVASGGSINMIDGGQIKIGQPIWMKDADTDGYPSSSDPPRVSATAPIGYVRRNSIANWTLPDCDELTNTKWRNQTAYTDADGDGYGTGMYQTVCSGIFPPVGYSQCGPATSGNPCAGHMRNITDCAPNDINNWDLVDLYADADGDTYTSGSISQVCLGPWYGVPAGYQESPTNPVDCYDSNANAKPGQCTYYSVHRGDGSFDYDCVDHPECSSNCPTECGVYQSGDRDFEIPWMGGCWGQCTSACGCTVDYSCATCPGGGQNFRMTYAGWMNASAQPANYPICGQSNTYCNTVNCAAACNTSCSSVFTKCK